MPYKYCKFPAPICGCINTRPRRNYLCAEADIVELLFGALQGGSSGFWKAQLLAFQDLCPITMTVKVSLPKLHPCLYCFPPSLSFSFLFQMAGSTSLVVKPATPLRQSFQ